MSKVAVILGSDSDAEIYDKVSAVLTDSTDMILLESNKHSRQADIIPAFKAQTETNAWSRQG